MKTLETNLSAPVSANTPGPWKYIRRPTTCGQMFLISNPATVEAPHGPVICLYDDSTSLSTCKPGEQEANARLIAAAPELLAAIKIGLRHVEYHTSALGDNPTAELMRAAIAKAEGRAP